LTGYKGCGVYSSARRSGKLIVNFADFLEGEADADFTAVSVVLDGSQFF
jgi:hypothetical protein